MKKLGMLFAIGLLAGCTALEVYPEDLPEETVVMNEPELPQLAGIDSDLEALLEGSSIFEHLERDADGNFVFPEGFEMSIHGAVTERFRE